MDEGVSPQTETTPRRRTRDCSVSAGTKTLLQESRVVAAERLQGLPLHSGKPLLGLRYS